GDQATIKQQVEWARGKPEAELDMLGMDSAVAASHGQLRRARELTQRAIELAGQLKRKDAEAGALARPAVARAEVGQKRQAGGPAAPRRRAASPPPDESGRGVPGPSAPGGRQRGGGRPGSTAARPPPPISSCKRWTCPWLGEWQTFIVGRPPKPLGPSNPPAR